MPLRFLILIMLQLRCSFQYWSLFNDFICWTWRIVTEIVCNWIQFAIQLLLLIISPMVMCVTAALESNVLPWQKDKKIMLFQVYILSNGCLSCLRCLGLSNYTNEELLFIINDYKIKSLFDFKQNSTLSSAHC